MTTNLKRMARTRYERAVNRDVQRAREISFLARQQKLMDYLAFDYAGDLLRPAVFGTGTLADKNIQVGDVVHIKTGMGLFGVVLHIGPVHGEEELGASVRTYALNYHNSCWTRTMMPRDLELKRKASEVDNDVDFN
jgi:hypothetical protein